MAKKFEQLTFSDDFMFCKVLQNNPDLCRELLELVLDRPVGDLVETTEQKPIRITADGRGVRFDVYAKDDQSVIYDIEMQNERRDHIPKRARYAQSMIDASMSIRKMKFRDLPRSYVIFICQFNLFPAVGRHKYSFRNRCVEDPTLELGDDAEKIFLCTKGTLQDISPEMEQFLSYIARGIADSGLPRKLEDAVDVVRQGPQWRREYMSFVEEYIEDAIEEAKEEARKEAREEGKEEGREEGREEGLAQGRKEERANTVRERARAEAAEEEVRKLRAELAKYQKSGE